MCVRAADIIWMPIRQFASYDVCMSSTVFLLPLFISCYWQINGMWCANKQAINVRSNERASELMNEWMNVSLFYVRSHELGFLFRFLWSLITARSTKSSTMPIKNEKKKKRHVLQQRSFSMRRVSFHLRNIRRNKKSDDKQTTNNSNRNIYTDCDAHQNRLVELVSFISRNDDDYYCLCLHKIQIIHSKWIHSCWCERVLDVPKQIK